MGQMCYLCRRKPSKPDRISLHKFPKNPIARNKWMKACNLSICDKLTYIYICSMHFNAKDIDKNEYQTRCVLRAGAVPSIGVPNQICSNNENIYTLNDGTQQNAKTNKVETTNIYENGLDNEVLKKFNVFDNATTPVVAHASDETPIEQCEDFVKRPRLITADATLESAIDANVRQLEERCFTTPKRRVFEPRYISEIRTLDFGTPERTSRILNFVKDTDKKKSKLIKSLQDRNRKLEKRLSSLEEIIIEILSW